MDQWLYLVLPQLLLVGFGVLLGIWAILLRRTDLGLEAVAIRFGWLAAAVLGVWMVALAVHQRQLPILNPGQLAFFLAALVWFGQCYAQRWVNQRLFAVLPLLGVVGLMVLGLVSGLHPGAVTRFLVGPEVAVHASLSLAGVALLLGCGVFATGHMILHQQIRRRRFDAWFQRLPSLGDLDRLRRLTLVTGTALVVASVATAMIWTSLRPGEEAPVISHLHPMLLLAALLVALVVVDRRRWWSANGLAVGCVVMCGVMVTLLCVSVIEIFQGRGA
ncbi:MAG: hypothetical protein RBT60_08130 [Candidatus Krumholzibacteria bacterium]|jgi:ABC-type uncharacterized transport system permease subunit|nr:hypothetical protein [Candidatus Krumholzibacteria bacterium]